MITQDYYGNYEISIRTPLEASMYLQAKEVSERDEVDILLHMINNINPGSSYGQQMEVRLCERLIIIMGPNRENSRRYKFRYNDIIEGLRKLREDKDIWEPILISQEITFIREYYGRDESLNIDVRIRWLEKAINIADNVLDRIEHYGVHVGTRNAIIVETANSKLLLCQLKKRNDTILYRELRRDLKQIIKYDNQNFHAYVALLKTSITEFDNETDNIKQVELIENMCSLVDQITFSNSEVAESEYFQRQVTTIYSKLSNTNIVQEYVDELALNGSAAGVYMLAKKRLYDSGVDFRSEINTVEQYTACEYVYNVFSQEKYKEVVNNSQSCQYMLLNVIWLMKNGKPIHQQGECWTTSMTNDVWKELSTICNRYIINFDSDNSGSFGVDKNMRYIQALCMAQLGQYQECLSVLKSIEEDSTIGFGRIYTKYMICDENGIPKKFTGRLGRYNEIDRSGVLYIQEFGNNSLYYYSHNLKTSNFEEGIVFDDLEVGFSNISAKVYRNIENERK